MKPHVMEIVREKGRFKRLPAVDKLAIAERQYSVQHSWQRQTPPFKPRVTVIKAQGKPLLVLRIGKTFVSSFTWETLLEKVAFRQWKRIAGTTLEKRLP